MRVFYGYCVGPTCKKGYNKLGDKCEIATCKSPKNCTTPVQGRDVMRFLEFLFILGEETGVNDGKNVVRFLLNKLFGGRIKSDFANKRKHCVQTVQTILRIPRCRCVRGQEPPDPVRGVRSRF